MIERVTQFKVTKLFLAALMVSAALFAFGAQSRVCSAPEESEKKYLGFDRNNYPGDDALPILRKTFAFSSYWISPPPGEKSNTWTRKRELLCSRGFGFVVLYQGPVAANLKLKPQPKPEELATERTLRPLRKQRASPPGQLFFWILKKADDFPTPTMPISRRGRKPSVRQDFAPVPIAQACPSRKSPAFPFLP